MTTDETPEKVEGELADQNAFCLEYIEKVDAICKKYRVAAYDKLRVYCEIATAAFILVATDADYRQFSEQLSKPGNPMPYFVAEGTLAILKERGVNRATVREYMENRIKEFKESARKGMHTPRGD